jgi:AraC family transcriptional regulator of arabinose operon
VQQPRRPTDPRIDRLCQTLARPKSGTISRARDAAATLNISLSRLRHLFKQETGMSFGSFVKRVHLDCAKKLLLSSSLLVKEVASECGFNDVSHFVRDFEAIYGESPAKFRLREAKKQRQPFSLIRSIFR